MKVYQKIKDFLHELEVRIDWGFYNDDFDKYVGNGIRFHTRILEFGKQLSNRDDFYWQVRKQYESAYCPPWAANLDTLTNENKEKYFFMRLDIDKLLEETWELETP